MSNARELILQTTCTLLEKQGYHGTGLNEIVKESGSPKGSLYHYFPEGKDQITAEAVLQSGRQTAERIRTELSKHENSALAVSSFIENIATHVELSQFAAGSPLTAVAMETATKSERINAACKEAYDLLQNAFIEKFISNHMSAEHAQAMATFIVAAIEGGIILSRTEHDSEPLRVVARQIKTLLS